MRRLTLLALLAGGMVLQTAAAKFPDRPLTLVIAFAPGGTSSIIGRAAAQYMSAELGKPIVVENRPGAGGGVGTLSVARAAADGYTTGLATVSTHVINPACNPALGYDPVNDFKPVVMLARSAKVIAVNPDFPAKNFDEFRREVASNPGRYSYATSGVCALGHMLGEQYKQLTATDMMHVPYRGAGPALTDVLAGQVPILIDNLPAILPSIKAGKLRPIAISWPQRLPDMPDVPTFAEVGLTELNQPAWHGLVAPAGTSDEAITALNDAARKALERPALIKIIRDTGAEPVGNTPAEFAEEIRVDFGNMKVLVKAAKIQIN